MTTDTNAQIAWLKEYLSNSPLSAAKAAMQIWRQSVLRLLGPHAGETVGTKNRDPIEGESEEGPNPSWRERNKGHIQKCTQTLEWLGI